MDTAIARVGGRPHLPERYHSQNMPKTLRDAFVASKTDPEITSLKDELALLRGLLHTKIQELETDADITPAWIEEAIQLNKEIRETVKVMMTEGNKLGLYIRIENYPLIIEAFQAVVNDFIDDPRAKTLIADRLGRVAIGEAP